MNPRTMAAIAAGKAAGAASRVLGRGGGTAIAGIVAERIDPGIVRALASKAGAGAICVTGTNGKTTTSLMLNRIAAEAGLRPLHNRSGSNMMRGVAAELVREATLAGGMPEAARRLAILEIDEATLPQLVRQVTPRAIVFTNLFRDQLDRYGEVDTVARSWERAIAPHPPAPSPPAERGSENAEDSAAIEPHPPAPLFGELSAFPLAERGSGEEAEHLSPGLRPPPLHSVARGTGEAATEMRVETTLVLNADDPAVAHLGRDAQTAVLYYGIDDTSAATEAGEHASDFRTCLDCGAELAYAAAFYGHIGHWRCERCGNARPRPDVRITQVTHRGTGMELTIDARGTSLRLMLPLAGLYNAYNALAAAAGAIALGLPHDAIVRALEGFTAAFGRQERFEVDGRDVRVLLGKNPTGLNQVLRAIADEGGERTMLFFLNDGLADGRDISWIWDADYEAARPGTAWAMAAGNRAEDLALRMKYAGFGDEVPLEHEASRALQRSLDATPAGGTLYVVPTYTAMLEVRELLAKRSGGRRFWEDA